MSGPATAPCRLLEWDTEFFGFRIGRVEQARLAEPDLERVLSWCAQERIACLYFEATADDPLTVRLAERAGFQLVDVRMDLELRPLRVPLTPEKAASLTCRAATCGDVPRLQEIARSAFTDTRFYFDERFPRERCAALYATWVERSCCDGFAATVRVVEDAGEPAGFLTCQLEQDPVRAERRDSGIADGMDALSPARERADVSEANAGKRGSPVNSRSRREGGSDGSGRIGLVAVADESRGRGVGPALLADSLQWFAAQGVGRVVTTTQGRNVRAQRFYQEAGFTTARVSLFYHFWRG